MHPQTANLTHVLKVLFSHSIHPSGPRKHIPQKKMSPRTTSEGICLGRHKHNIYPRPENMLDSFLSQRIHWSPKRVTLCWLKEFQNSVPCLQTEPSYPEQKVLLLTITINILMLAGTTFWWCPGHGKKTSGASGCNLPASKPLLPMCTFQKACLTPQGLTAFHQLTNRFPLTQVDHPSTGRGSDTCSWLSSSPQIHFQIQKPKPMQNGTTDQGRWQMKAPPHYHMEPILIKTAHCHGVKFTRLKSQLRGMSYGERPKWPRPVTNAAM